MICRRVSAGLVGAVVAVLVMAGCGGGGGSSDTGSEAASSGRAVTIVDLEPFAVAASDLPDGFDETQRQTEESAAACLRPTDDTEKELAERIQGFGLIGCQAVTYVHTVGAESDQAGTFAILFRNADGAQGALPLLRDILVKSYRATGDAKVVSVTELPVPVLGDSALPGILFKVSAGTAETEHTIYLWRRGKVVAVLAAANFVGAVGPDASRDIATKIDIRAAG